MLTVADINATNPRLWTDWKGSLMRNLYFRNQARTASRALVCPGDQVRMGRVTPKTAALRLLATDGISESAGTERAWSDVDEEFFPARARRRRCGELYSKRSCCQRQDRRCPRPSYCEMSAAKFRWPHKYLCTPQIDEISFAITCGGTRPCSNI